MFLLKKHDCKSLLPLDVPLWKGVPDLQLASACFLTDD